MTEDPAEVLWHVTKLRALDRISMTVTSVQRASEDLKELHKLDPSLDELLGDTLDGLDAAARGLVVLATTVNDQMQAGYPGA